MLATNDSGSFDVPIAQKRPGMAVCGLEKWRGKKKVRKEHEPAQQRAYPANNNKLSPTNNVPIPSHTFFIYYNTKK